MAGVTEFPDGLDLSKGQPVPVGLTEPGSGLYKNLRASPSAIWKT